MNLKKKKEFEEKFCEEAYDLDEHKKIMFIKTESKLCDILQWIEKHAKQERKKVLKNYYKLIMSVSCKHKGETRYQTALRYIENAEIISDSPGKKKE